MTQQSGYNWPTLASSAAQLTLYIKHILSSKLYGSGNKQMLRVRGNLICCFPFTKYNKTGSLVPFTLLRNQLWDLDTFRSFCCL